jgi:hypothetical protein
MRLEPWQKALLDEITWLLDGRLSEVIRRLDELADMLDGRLDDLEACLDRDDPEERPPAATSRPGSEASP